MCGRYTLRSGSKKIAEAFGVAEPEGLSPRFNVAPTQGVLAVRAAGAGRELASLRWGLIPSWSKDKSVGARLINARAETAAEKPSFRAAFKRRRCLVLADGFFEWKADGKKKQPYYVTLKDDGVFAFAGLWEEWRGAEGEIASCTVVTTEANELMRPLHERMPVIIDPIDYDGWLGLEEKVQGALVALLRPYPSEAMAARPVGTRVNSPRNDDPACVEPLLSLSPL